MRLTRRNSLLLPGLLACGLTASADPPRPSTFLKTETFDRDPGWDGKGHRLVPKDPPTVRQDFGHSAATNHAGEARGEIGGEFWRSLQPAYYGKRIPERSFETALSASGSLALLKAQSISGWQSGATIFVGWFRADARDLIWRPRNFLGFRLEASNEPDGAHVEVCYGTSAWQAGGTWVDAAGGGQERNVSEFDSGKLLRIPPDGSRRRWSLRYDPAAGGAGEIVFGFDGAETRLGIGDELRHTGARFDRFGIFACRIPGRSMVAYFDDITLDGQLEDFAKDPGWDGAGNRATFKDLALYGHNDFGFSPGTHHSGGERPGELGGRFFSCDPPEEEFKAHYGDRIGSLSLEDHSVARGKLAAPEFCIDATFALGWFNSRRQGWPIENFVGVYFDSLSTVGRIAQPLYGTAQGSKDRSGGHVTFEPGAGKRYDWTLEYDPAGGGGHGSIAFTIGGQRVVKPLPPGEKAKGADLDRFGVFNMQWANSKWCDVYLDDLTYTAAVPHRKLSAGVHLFLDDDLIASQRNLRRTIHPPRRLPRPIVTGKEDKCFQPYVSVLREPQSRRFRLWYNSAVSSTRSHVAHLESEDGIEWIRPHCDLEDPGGLAVGFGAYVVDDGPESSDPRRRYKLAWENGGLYTAFSPDGLTWTPSSDRPVLHNDMGDIISLSRDPIRNRYLLLCKAHSTPADGYRGSTPNAQEGYRRLVGQSVSDDCVKWSPVRRIIAPDDRDDGITEFYGIGQVIARGELLVGTLKVLRDDLAPEPGGERTGIGYTVLAWTRDGETWHRDREPFLDRNPEPGTWDRAMTWGDCLLSVGDEVFLYYGGYARGHKVERFTERQIGLARLQQDRYVSRDAGPAGGSLRTPVVTLGAVSELPLVNADVAGELRVRVLDAAGAPIPGFDAADCAPIRGDSLRHRMAWQRPLASLAGRQVQLEFVLREARLYAFELRAGLR